MYNMHALLREDRLRTQQNKEKLKILFILHSPCTIFANALQEMLAL